MGQVGHADSKMTMDVYAQLMLVPPRHPFGAAPVVQLSQDIRAGAGLLP